MKAKYCINLHKGFTFVFILALMAIYQNYSLAAWVYLALHGTYGILWLLKDQFYPDQRWEAEIPFGLVIISFFLLSLYWVAPFILISTHSQPSLPLIAAAISLNLFGIFLHYGSDAQKYYTLKYKSGLITEGFFARCRNPNYLGEACTYISFAMLAEHWLPFAIVAFMASLVWIPNMLKKDQSLSRYPEFESYKANSGLIFPKLWSRKSEDLIEISKH